MDLEKSDRNLDMNIFRGVSKQPYLMTTEGYVELATREFHEKTTPKMAVPVFFMSAQWGSASQVSRSQADLKLASLFKWPLKWMICNDL